MTPGSTQHLTESSTRAPPGRKGLPARKGDKLNTICEPILLEKMWEPWRLTTLRSFKVCYRESFAFLFIDLR
jgi:hypothetical protein